MRFRILTVSLVVSVLALFSSGCSKEQRAARALDRADKFLAANETDRAEIEYLNALKLAPTNPRAIGGLGRLYYDIGAITRSIPYLLGAHQLAPENEEINLRFSMLMVAVGERPKAQVVIRNLLRANPKHPEAPMVFVDTLQNANEIAEAKSFLKGLPNGAPDGAPVLTALALLTIKEGNLAGAKTLLDQAATVDPKYDIVYGILSKIADAERNHEKAEEYARRGSQLAPPMSSRRLTLAQWLIARNDTAGAAKELEGILKQSPVSIAPRILLAQMKARLGQKDDSLKYLGEALSKDPGNPDALLLRARVYQSIAKLPEAQKDLEKLLTGFPAHAEAQLQLATVHLGQGDINKGMALLMQAQASNPNLLEASIMLAELNLRQGNAPEALVLVSSIRKKDPSFVPARLLLAEIYRVTRRFEEAHQVLLEVERDFPNDPRLPMLRGAVDIQAGQPKRAREAYERAVQLSNNGQEALEQLTALDLNEGKFDAAIKRVEALLDSGRKESDLFTLLGRAQAVAGRSKEAEASFRKAIEIKPDNRGAYFLLARLYIDLKETEKALDNLRVVTEKNPNDTSALLLMGILLEQKNDFESAKTAYEKLLRVDPKFGPALNNLAYLYAERFNRLEEAHELGNRAREAAPNDPYAADTLGWILYRQGKYTWALSLVREAVDKLPNSGEAQYHLGMIHYRMGDEAAARTAFENSLRLEPEFNGRADAQARLTLLSSNTATVEQLTKMLEQTPNDPIVLNRLGRLYLSQGKPQKAIETYSDVLKTSPESVVAMKGLAMAHFAAGDMTKAIDAARNARKSAGDDAELGALLARASWAKGDRRFAYTLLQDAARRLPGDTELQADFAEAAYSQGKLDEWRAASALAPTKSEWAKDGSAKVAPLMDAAKKASSPSDARKALEQALEIYPEFIPAMRELAIRLVAAESDETKAYELASKAREADASDKEIAQALGTLALKRGEFARAATLLGEAASGSTNARVHFQLGKAQSQVRGSNPKPALTRALELGLSGAEKQEAEGLLKK